MAATELWRHPNPEGTQMWKFLQHVNSKYGLNLKGYPDLYRWSVDNVADFWGEVWHFVGIKSSRLYDEVRSMILLPSRPLDLKFHSLFYRAI